MTNNVSLPLVLNAKVYRETAAWWTAHNPVLPNHSVGQESDVSFGAKVGDGSTPWNSLPYLGGGSGTSLLFPFTFADAAALVLGVDTGIVIPDGRWVGYGEVSIRILTKFNGTAPKGFLATSQADAAAGANQLAGGATTSLDSDPDAASGNAFVPTLSYNNFYTSGGDVHLWLAAWTTAHGTPLDSTAGAAVVQAPQL